METWRKGWRDGFVPHLSTAALRALAHGLRSDDPSLIQGASTLPYVKDDPTHGSTVSVEGACAACYGHWRTYGFASVAEAEAFFVKVCWLAGTNLGEPTECRRFLCWFDDTPRAEMRRELLSEVELALESRSPFSTEAL